MGSERPINANVPIAEPDAPAAHATADATGASVPEEAPAAGPAKPGSAGAETSRAHAPPRRRRELTGGAPLAIAALIALALTLIAAAILGGGTSQDDVGTVVGPQQPAGAPAEYPRIATSNTTRIEGADPASRAAAAAFAAYPATDEVQRPSAVTLVDASDWRSAIAASVLMAAPVGAPLLLSEAGGTPEVTSEAVEGLHPVGNTTTKGAQAFAVGDVAAPDGLRVRRVGPTGIAGATAVARLRQSLSGRPPERVVVAPAHRPAFAMPAAAWAARSGDPVLFTAGDRLSRPTANALKGLRRTPVYVLGPSSVISSRVVREIAESGSAVRRVSGENPVENSLALARYSDGDFGWNLNDPGHGFVVARSNSPLDAAGAAPLSASGTWGALLLTNRSDRLPAALRRYLLDVKPGYTTDPTRAFYNHVWVIGDEEAISVTQQAQIDELAALTKIGGES